MNKRRKSIVEHALALFSEKGIQNTSVQDIIDRSGISKGTFYNYFSSKNECIRAILELIRYEVSLSRSELLIGKDAQDLDLLIEQITLLAKTNDKRGMHAIYEELLYSGDAELKQLVLKHRITELEWLAERLVEVYGEPLRPYSFESSVLFYGMYHHLQFARNLAYQHAKDLRMIAASVFHYLQFIIDSLVHEQTAVLETGHLDFLRDQVDAKPIRLEDAIELLEELLQECATTSMQQELGAALLAELQQSALRVAVIHALLKPFVESFEDTATYKRAKDISTTVWYYLKQR